MIMAGELRNARSSSCPAGHTCPIPPAPSARAAGVKNSPVVGRWFRHPDDRRVFSFVDYCSKLSGDKPGGSGLDNAGDAARTFGGTSLLALALTLLASSGVIAS